MSGPYIVLLFSVVILALFLAFITVLSRYKKCPSDKILVIYGKIGKGKDGYPSSSKCIHGGAAFIWPVFQHYQFLDLTPISIEVNLTKALSNQNIRVDVPSRFTVGISTEQTIMVNAAERLLGLGLNQIQELAKDIIFGQLRLVIATMKIEEINSDRDKFLANVSNNVENELKKIGLKLINVNVTDIKDESGYIEALGKEAAAKAINDAKISVAEKNRDGSIGEANAKQEERIQVSKANAAAVEGENLAKIMISVSDSERREKEAEVNRKAIAAEKVQSAMALEEAYEAEKSAETKRAEKVRATKTADEIIPAEIAKQKMEIDAEADAEMTRRQSKGEADGKLFIMQAQAQGMLETLSKQAEGFQKIIEAAGQDPKNAAMLMITDKLPEIIQTQVEAIKNLKIDKITVWDSNSDGKGGNTTSNFLSGMVRSIPPLDELFRMAGMELPDYLGKKSQEKPQGKEKPQK